MEAIGSSANDEKLAAEAMARIAADAAALSPEELVQVNLDLQEATGTILGTLPEVMALREQIAKQIPAFNLAYIDKLEDYTLALRFAHAAFQTAVPPEDDLTQLAEDATTLRERLLADAQALSLHGLVDRRKLESLKGANGVQNIAQDLQMLSQVLQENWAQIQGKTATVLDDLSSASRMATRITRIVGLRDQSPGHVEAVTEQRQRVFTLVLRAYDETRAAITFVRRREGDAESITPNLYTGKGRTRATAKPQTDTTQPPAPAAVAPVAAAVTPPTVPPEAVAAAVAAQRGGPGSKEPFIS